PCGTAGQVAGAPEGGLVRHAFRDDLRELSSRQPGAEAACSVGYCCRAEDRSSPSRRAYANLSIFPTLAATKSAQHLGQMRCARPSEGTTIVKPALPSSRCAGRSSV